MHSEQPTKVFLADESALIRTRVAALPGTPSMRIVGQAGAAQAALEGILAERPDVVVLDVQLQGGSGLDVMKGVLPQAPRTAFIIFSSHAEPMYRRRYLDAGAYRFLDKSSESDRLAQAICDAADDVHEGEKTHAC